MAFKITAISSLEKVRELKDIRNEVSSVSLFRGETYSYQIVVQSDRRIRIKVIPETALAVKVYSVDNAVVDFPYIPQDIDSGYMTYECGVMPDILTPVELKANNVTNTTGLATFWIQVDVPEKVTAGDHNIKLHFEIKDLDDKLLANETHTLTATVSDDCLPTQELIFTQWLHTDCIATTHKCDVYSERHWDYIKKYIKVAQEIGINMIYTPVISPPLDTAVGAERPNVQLVKIEKTGDKYKFDFSLLERWIDISLECGIEYFEISHLFSQGGAKYSPNIYGVENGEEKLIFGWHIEAKDERYKNFLASLLPELTDVFCKRGLEDKVYFHISDEPTDEHLEAYEYACSAVKPYIGKCRTFDALSHYDFYERGLVENPVCNTLSIEPFIENKADNLWAYYCCGGHLISNRFLAMPASRNRIMGLQMYKFGIKGFLHWGLNFYYSCGSLYEVNPYISTSTDRNFPSGDPFSVYPHETGPLKSMRALVFKESLQDILICRMLEEKIGKDAVVKMIDDAAGYDLTFKKYPMDANFVPDLISKMKEMI